MAAHTRTYYSIEAEQRAKRSRFVLAATVFVLGAGIGAILAILFAPSEGEKTRNQLGHRIEDGYESSRDAVSDRLERGVERIRQVGS